MSLFLTEKIIIIIVVLIIIIIIKIIIIIIIITIIIIFLYDNVTWENTSANAVIKRCPGNFSFSTIPSLPVLAFCTAFEPSVSLN